MKETLVNTETQGEIRRTRTGRLFRNIQPFVDTKNHETLSDALERLAKEFGPTKTAQLLEVSPVAIEYRRKKSPYILQSPSESQREAHRRKDLELRQKVIDAFPGYESFYEIINWLYENDTEKEVAEKLRNALGLEKFSRTKVATWLKDLNIPSKKRRKRLSNSPFNDFK